MSAKTSTNQDTITKARFYLVDGRMYQEMDLGVDGQLGLSDMDKFL